MAKRTPKKSPEFKPDTIQEFYIREKYAKGATVEELAPLLSTSVEQLQAYIKANSVKRDRVESKFEKLVAKKKGAVVATQASSEYGDTLPKQPPKSAIPSDCISPIRRDE